jgi:hypothetical protein
MHVMMKSGGRFFLQSSNLPRNIMLRKIENAFVLVEIFCKQPCKGKGSYRTRSIRWILRGSSMCKKPAVTVTCRDIFSEESVEYAI